MTGDCGHGWGWHYDGAAGPCWACHDAINHPIVKKLEAVVTLARKFASVNRKDTSRSVRIKPTKRAHIKASRSVRCMAHFKITERGESVSHVDWWVDDYHCSYRELRSILGVPL